MRFATGEYISFLESDDAITKTAFEELYKIAKDFSADVVCCEKFYEVTGDGKISDKKIKPSSYIRKNFETEPTLLSDDIEYRVNELYRYNFLYPIWTKLIRREFIMEENLQMVNVNHHDMIYTVCLVCSAKKIVRVPNIINLYRVLDDSLSHKQDTWQKTLSGKFKTLANGFNYVDKFLDEQEGFKNRTDLKYIALDVIVREFINYLLPIYAQIPPYQLNEIIYNELNKIDSTENLTAFLFSRMNVFNINLIKQQQMIQQLQTQLQKIGMG